jgi:hypothetical protein
VEGCAADHYAADIDRIEDGDRGQRTVAPDADDDVPDARGDLGRRELVGGSPTRLSRGEAQFLLVAELIDLDDDAVDLEWKIGPPCLPVFAALPDFLDGVAEGGFGRRFKAQVTQQLQRFILRLDLGTTPRVADAIGVQA